MHSLLQINTNVGWNSTGRIIEDIGRLAMERGWLSTIAYGRNINGVPSSASRLVRVGNNRDVWAHGISTRLFDRHGLGSRKATLNLIKRIEEIRPNIVHLHNIHGYYLNYPELFSYLNRIGVPVVWTLHDCWSFTGHCAYFDMADCRKWTTGCNRCPLKSMYPASIVCDNSVRNYEIKKETFTSLENLHIVTVSNWLKNVVDRSFLGKYPSYVIYDGIDVESEPVRKTPKERLVVGAASKWDPRKGLNTFVELRKILPDDVRIVLIGLSARQIHSLPTGIEGLPRINEREALNEWYRRASVFVNPSMSETLSITNIEAQGCGTPVVAFDSGGMRETIMAGTGLLVTPEDVDGLAGAVNTILNSPGKFSRNACQEHVKAKFNKTENFNRYIDLYESILASKNAVIPELAVN